MRFVLLNAAGEIVLLIVGIVLLVASARLLVDGASNAARKMKVSSFVVGATIVAVGTSAPEIAVTIADCVSGEGEIVVGNIVGSNVANVLLILGVCALVSSIPAHLKTRWPDFAIFIGASALFILLGCLGWSFTWWDGLILALLYIGYVAFSAFAARRQSLNVLSLESSDRPDASSFVSCSDEEAAFCAVRSGESEGKKCRASSWYRRMCDKAWFLVLLIVLGIACVAVGAELVVTSVEYIAEELMRIPVEIVAITIVAVGTSLPELVTSVTAAVRGDTDLAMGNVLGSNITNILLLGGLGAICSLSEGLEFSMSGLVGACVGLLAAAVTLIFSLGKKKSLGKAAGIVLIALFVLYYAFIFLNLFAFGLY